MQQPGLHPQSAHRFRKHSGLKGQLHVDMTPMVDLGFLLIAFFIFTTEVSKPVATHLYMPHDGNPMPISNTRSMTIMLEDRNRIFYYFGEGEKALRSGNVFTTTSDEKTGIGDKIRRKQAELQTRLIDKKQLFVVIKAGKNCSYQLLVNTLDEMLINGVSRYTLADLKIRSSFTWKITKIKPSIGR